MRIDYKNNGGHDDQVLNYFQHLENEITKYEKKPPRHGKKSVLLYFDRF